MEPGINDPVGCYVQVWSRYSEMDQAVPGGFTENNRAVSLPLPPTHLLDPGGTCLIRLLGTCTVDEFLQPIPWVQFYE